MRSDKMKKGIEKAPHRSLFKAMGYMDEEIKQPIIGVVNSKNELVPGMLMAAMRLNIPSVFVSGGPMISGKKGEKETDLITVFEGVGGVKAGSMTEEELKELEDTACPGCGSCAGECRAYGS